MTGISLADWQAAQQRILDMQAELAYARPVADAGWVYHAESLAGYSTERINAARRDLFAACTATTPSKTPPTHVIVAVDRLAYLEAIERAAGDWCVSAVREQEFLRPTAKVLYQVMRKGLA